MSRRVGACAIIGPSATSFVGLERFELVRANILEINFETMELRELCEDESVAAGRLGVAAAEELKNRLADIRAADSMDIVLVLAGQPQIGTYLNSDCVRIDLAGNLQLVVVPNHASPRKLADGGAAWNRVKRVRVVALEPQ